MPSSSRAVRHAWIVAATLAATPLAADQTPRFGASADLVVVDVLVTRDGRAVTDLTAADFEVRDSGVAQQVTLAAVSSLPVNLLLVLDTSASVRGEPLEHLKAGAKAATAGLRPTDEAAIMTFSHAVTLATAWTADRSRIADAVDAVTAQGSTALADAAFAALALRARANARRLVVFFTDGDDTSSWLAASDLVGVARRTDAVVYGVTLPSVFTSAGQTAPVADWLLSQPSLYRNLLLPVLADETGGESLRLADGAALAKTFADIVARFNARYVLTYTPAGVTGTGWRPLDVKVRGEGLTVTARRGYVRQ
jgi:VWFA-related protein